MLVIKHASSIASFAVTSMHMSPYNRYPEEGRAHVLKHTNLQNICIHSLTHSRAHTFYFIFFILYFIFFILLKQVTAEGPW